MFRKFHRPLAWLTLFAWLSASGLSWDALQVFAWAKMSVDNARGASLGAAVGKAMTDAPCPLCVAAQEGRKQSEQAPPAGQELAKAKAKAKVPTTLWEFGAVGPSTAGRFHGRPEDVFAEVRADEVPVPPPRAQA